MTKNIITLIFILWMFFSCNNAVKHPILFSEFNLPQETDDSLSVLLTDSFRITPLETTSESLIGVIDKIKKFQGHYYISVSNGQSILCFNNDGKFVSSLNKQGQGPEEYLRVEDFDLYEINGQPELWISDNESLKIYSPIDFSFKYKIPLTFIIYKFKRLNNNHILLITGQSKYSLTLIDNNGNILAEYLEKEFPFLMFRSVQFIPFNSDYIYQLGISNSCVVFNTENETFTRSTLSPERSFISDSELLDLYDKHDMSFILEANKMNYISNIISFKDKTWIQTYHAGENYLTKIVSGKTISTTSLSTPIKNDLFDIKDSSFLLTITQGESDEGIILCIDSYLFAENKNNIYDKYGNKIKRTEEDNPCLIEFY